MRRRRFNNGLEFQLVEVNTLAFADNTRYEFRMSVETLTDHTRFHLEIDPEDGTHVLEYEDFSPNRFTAGRAGLRKKHGPDACWDDLTVAALGGLPSRAKPDPATPGASQTPTKTPGGGGGRGTATALHTPTASNTPSTTPGTLITTNTPGGGGGRATKTPSPTTGPGTPSPTQEPTRP